MSKFALKEVEQVNGKFKIYKLAINDICQFDEFCEEIENNGNLVKELKAAFGIMNAVSNNQSLPQVKFRDITPAKQDVKEYEVKKGSLRFYLIKDISGKLILYCGMKGNQSEDIKKFRRVKKEYLDSLKSKP